MNNKKWVFASLSTGVLIYLVSTIIYISVDAQSVFGKSITDKKFEYTQYYSIKQFDDLQSGQYSLIFGSSQMQKLSSRKLRKNILNLYNLHGSPNLILNFLSQLDEEKIKNVEHVYFNISVFSLLWEDEEAMINYKSNSYFDKLLYILPLSNAGMLATVRDIVNNIFENNIYYYIDDDGSLLVNAKDQGNIFSSMEVEKGSIESIKKSKAIEAILKLNDFCIDNNLPITYFTPTLSAKYSIDVETRNYLWTRLLEGGIDGFYELYYVNGVSDNQLNNLYYNFRDPVHLNYNSMNNVFQDIVLDKDNSRFISNKNELNTYINELKVTIKNLE
jgi:hypothetical protein